MLRGGWYKSGVTKNSVSKLTIILLELEKIRSRILLWLLGKELSWKKIKYEKESIREIGLESPEAVSSNSSNDQLICGRL